MKSQASAISLPPPSAKPFTAAITAIGSSCSLAMTAWPSRAKVLACKAVNRRQLPDVRTGHKGLSPAPGEHQHPDVLVGGHLVERLGKLGQKRRLMRSAPWGG